MTENTRTLSVSIEGETDMDSMKQRFHDAVDEPFMNDVSEVDFKGPEVEGVCPGAISIDVTADVEAMKIEAKFYLNSEFQKATVSVVPTDEEIQEAIEEIPE